MKNIALISLFVSLFVVSNSASAMTFAEKTAKIEKKKASMERSIDKIEVKFNAQTDLYITKQKEDVLKKKYTTLLGKIDKLQLKLESPQYKSIYKAVYIDAINDLEAFFEGEVQELDASVVSRQVSFDTTGMDVKVGKTEEEKKEIVSSITSWEKEYNFISSKEREEARANLIANGVSEKETIMLTMQTWPGDTFEFCANFTKWVYGQHEAFVFHTDAQWAYARDYKALVGKYYDNYYTDRVAWRNAGRAHKCAASMYAYQTKYNVSDKEVEEIYEKHFGEYVPFTNAFWLEGIQPENIESYIENHHKGN